MRIVYFTHSLASCWNHGNAHFVRGVLSELVARGHDVLAREPRGAWSLANLLADHGEDGLAPYRTAYPELRAETFDPADDPAELVDGADLVIMHEWNEPALVGAIGGLRARGGRFTLLFHDTHHRAVSDPAAMRSYDLDGYDAVLAFGETLDRYTALGAAIVIGASLYIARREARVAGWRHTEPMAGKVEPQI